MYSPVWKHRLHEAIYQRDFSICLIADYPAACAAGADMIHTAVVVERNIRVQVRADDESQGYERHEFALAGVAERLQDCEMTVFRVVHGTNLVGPLGMPFLQWAEEPIIENRGSCLPTISKNSSFQPSCTSTTSRPGSAPARESRALFGVYDPVSASRSRVR